LQTKVIKVIDVAYGGENGLDQAIELSQEALTNVKFVREKTTISKFFDEIAKDSGMVVYGINETMKAMDAGAVELLLCYENLDHKRVSLKNKETGIINIQYLSPNDANKTELYKDGEKEYE